MDVSPTLGVPAGVGSFPHSPEEITVDWLNAALLEAGVLTDDALASVEVTERKQAEEAKAKLEKQFRQAQKMEAIGTLAGGVAHDFNNLLTVIKGHPELALLRLKGEDPLYANMQQVKNAADRAASLTCQLLIYSRVQPMDLKQININESIISLLKMLGRLIGENVRIITDLEPDLLMISGDQGDIEQIVMNLAVNARDATASGGTLTFRTENVSVDKLYVESNLEAREGEFVKLSIEDTGTGMNKETQEHIFEPFYTTKEPGKGTGLGMSVVYGIVKEHNGWINIYSEIDQGTVFSILLPAAAAGPSKTKTQSATAVTALRGNGETILVVEDEESVKEIVKRLLTEFNYQVHEAANVKDGMELFLKKKDEIALVYTDIVLADSTGIELIEMILENKPDMKILLNSGYPGSRIRQDIIMKRDYPFIQKPYNMNELLLKIREILTGNPK